MPKSHINVCICTYLRCDLLAELLGELQGLQTDNLFDYSIIVVDNDSAQSALSVARHWQNVGNIKISYFCEKRKNISFARNILIKKATGDYLAFIDDDESPDRQWLLTLFKAIKAYHSFGVMGTVKPVYKNSPADWFLKLGFFSKERAETGTLVHRLAGSTSNLMIDAALLKECGLTFDPSFGRTGGEDKELVLRVNLSGYKVINCRESVVYEIVPESRQKIPYLLKRRLLQGMVHIRIITKYYSKPRCYRHLVKSMIAIVLYLMVTPIAACCGKHHFVNYLQKLSWHLGSVLEKIKMRPLKTRDDFERL